MGMCLFILLKATVASDTKPPYEGMHYVYRGLYHVK